MRRSDPSYSQPTLNEPGYERVEQEPYSGNFADAYQTDYPSTQYQNQQQYDPNVAQEDYQADYPSLYQDDEDQQYQEYHPADEGGVSFPTEEYSRYYGNEHEEANNLQDQQYQENPEQYDSASLYQSPIAPDGEFIIDENEDDNGIDDRFENYNDQYLEEQETSGSRRPSKALPEIVLDT